MKERPILFQGAMVRALLAGTKTQTRREVKWRGLEPGLNLRFSGLSVERSGSNFVLTSPTRTSHEYRSVPQPCPYGQPGDRLWVKETWRTAKSLDALSPSAIAEKCLDAGYSTPWAPLAYEADGHRNGAWRGFEAGGDAEPGKTRVNIHMPRWASRITLEITGVRVERLQAISEADAAAEGIHKPVGSQFWHSNDLPHLWAAGGGLPGETPQHAYRNLWELINGAGSWDANPWVWVVEFRKVTP